MIVEQYQFKCGHSGIPKPGLFGRGQARQKRLTAYFGRDCLECAKSKAVAHAHTLTNAKTQNAIDAIIDRRFTRLVSSYRMHRTE